MSRARIADVYVNIQGDEPLVSCEHIDTLVAPFLTAPEVQVTTLKIRATPEEAVSPTVNKVVTNTHGDALYFSKHAIPFDRDKRGVAVLEAHRPLRLPPRGARRVPSPAAVDRSSARRASSSCACSRRASPSACSRRRSPRSASTPRKTSGPSKPSSRAAAAEAAW